MAGLIGSSHSASIVELQPAEYYSKNKATITNFEPSFVHRGVSSLDNYSGENIYDHHSKVAPNSGV